MQILSNNESAGPIKSKAAVKHLLAVPGIYLRVAEASSRPAPRTAPLTAQPFASLPKAPADLVHQLL